MSQTTTLYRPIGSQELALIEASGWREFPPHVSEQPICYWVTDEAYAREIASDWNVRHNVDGLGFVTRFVVNDAFLRDYQPKIVVSDDDRKHGEYWIHRENWAAFNAAIEGRIEIIGAYGVDGDPSDALAEFPMSDGR